MQKKQFILTLGIGISTLLYSNEAFSQQTEQIDESVMKVTNEPVLSPEINVTENNSFIPMNIDPSIAQQSNIPQNIDFSTIINIGKMFWNIITEEQPVVNVHTDTASALPAGITNWQAMSGWKAPVAKPYSFNWEILGVDVIKFNYSIVYTYGGNVNGKGKYLTNVRIVPTDLDVMMGYKFSAQVDILSVTNAGSTSNPVGALEMMLKWHLDSPIGHYERSSTFYVTGAGAFKEVTSSSN